MYEITEKDIASISYERIPKRRRIPGLSYYEVRGNDSSGHPVTIENNVTENYYCSIVLKKSLNIPANGLTSFDRIFNDINWSEHIICLREFKQEYRSDNTDKNGYIKYKFCGDCSYKVRSTRNRAEIKANEFYDLLKTPEIFGLSKLDLIDMLEAYYLTGKEIDRNILYWIKKVKMSL